MKTTKVCLIGNPNVGKSSLFNILTSSFEHTGNWTGKTVASAMGTYVFDNVEYEVIDLPGTYSLFYESEEEKITSDYILHENYDIALVVADATNLERSLELLLEVLDATKNVVLALNLMDEVRLRQIKIQKEELENALSIPVVYLSTKENEGLNELKKVLANGLSSQFKMPHTSKLQSYLNQNQNMSPMQCFIDLVYKNSHDGIYKMEILHGYHFLALQLAKKTMDRSHEKESKLDKIFNAMIQNRFFSFFTLFFFLFVLLFLTISFSNLPSDFLFSFFSSLEQPIFSFFSFLPSFLLEPLIYGGYRTLYWVVSVMLPPMMIFFPLFSILEEFGFLPRIAFQLDHPFSKCGSCGKQCLTMCMGLGCNAVGVTGARIMENKKMKMLSILTNVFMPCNGRFPMILTIIALFFGGENPFISAILLTLVLLFGVVITLVVTKILNTFLFKNDEAMFVLELPHFRKPKIIKTIFLSWKEKVLHILGRAVVVAFPAGLLLFFFTHFQVGEISLFRSLQNALNPVGNILGVDGSILLAFLFGFPANEIVLPILFLSYSGGNLLEEVGSLSALKTILIDNHWTISTALSFLILSICHFPCATTMLTIKRETGSLFYTILAFVLPTLIGVLICFLFHLFA